MQMHHIANITDRSDAPRRNKAFSLIEMLVVLAVAVIMMGLILVPLVSTFNFTNRARRTVEVQDSARYAMELISREVSDSMVAVLSDGDYFPFLYYPGGTPGSGKGVVVRGAGYISAYDHTGTERAVPNALIDLVLPHDTLGLEGGGVTSPLTYQHRLVNGAQHPIIVRYFVGLSNPGVRAWKNNIVLKSGGVQNLYTLYRLEFDPYDARFAKWVLPTGEQTPDGREIWRVNPNFFYDTENGNHQYWRKRAVAVIPSSTMDLMDFERDPANGNNVLESRSLVTFSPMIVPAEAAKPASSDRQPSIYKTQYGHWTGLQNDGTVPYLNFSPAPPANMLPHIVVYRQDRDDDGALTLTSIFDTQAAGTGSDADPAERNRVLSWNSMKGTVDFAIAAPEFVGTGDAQTAAFSPLNSVSDLPPGAYLTPNSEVVTVWEGDGPNARPVVYSRSDTQDIYEVPAGIALRSGQPQQLPAPRTYIVTSDNRIIVGYPYPSPEYPLQPQPLPSGTKISVQYYYQNNDPDDIVKVDYQTRSLITVNLTARMYDPVNRTPITANVSNRVRLRNIQR